MLVPNALLVQIWRHSTRSGLTQSWILMRSSGNCATKMAKIETAPKLAEFTFRKERI